MGILGKTVALAIVLAAARAVAARGAAMLCLSGAPRRKMTVQAALQSGVTTALAAVLVMAAAAKLRRGGGARAPGRAVAELAIAAIAVAAPGAVSGAVLATAFAVFAVVHAVERAAGAADPGCGCFGETGAAQVAAGRRLALTAGAAIAAGAVAVTGAPSVLDRAIADPPDGLLVGIAAVVAALAWRAAFSTSITPASAGERLVTSSAMFLERRFSRRSVLVRVAVAGSALCVAPLRYLLYPGSALAVISPGSCAGGLCTDGYTAFCCEITGGVNTCPAGTFPGGWWMCTDYAGHRLCSEQGVRYYVDCNRLPGTAFPGGCHCAHGDCDYRRVACNVFRYGQCNTQIPGVTEVVCRRIVCENPGTIPSLNCSSSVAVDDAVCGHDVPCLEPAAVELTGAGGV